VWLSAGAGGGAAAVGMLSEKQNKKTIYAGISNKLEKKLLLNIYEFIKLYVFKTRVRIHTTCLHFPTPLS